MPDLRAAILTRLDQLEATARAATPGPWRTGTHASSAQTVYARDGETLIYDEGGHSEDDAQHIATWEPQAVLTLCAGARQLLDWTSRRPEYEPAGVHAVREEQPVVLGHLARMLGLDPDAT